MLDIKGIEKIVNLTGCSVKVKKLEPTDINHPPTLCKRKYDILFEHRDYPDREFLLTIDRESKRRSYNDELEYPIAIYDLTGPISNCKHLAIWESNLKTSTIFLDFVDTLTQMLVNY